MATQEDIETMVELIGKTHPARCFARKDLSTVGIGGALHLLDRARERGIPVTAGFIAEKMDVSTPRVAAMLKKMEARGLITRTRSAEDARMTVIALTDEGERFIEDLGREMRRRVGLIIDRIGVERLRAFIETAAEIGEVMEPPHIDI